MRVFLGVSLLVLTCLFVSGCKKPSAATGPAKAPEVVVAFPVRQMVTDYEEFPGRLDAIYTIQVRARAQGYLTLVNFVDGQDVAEGDVLAVIDQEPYDALLKAAKANVALNEANLRIANITLSRAQTSGTAASALEIDQDRAQVEQADANLKLARAQQATAQINYDFTTVRSPLTGRISRRMVDPGNVVKTDDTVLTTIVSLDPVYAYFDVDERTMLRLERLAAATGTPVPWKQGKPPTSATETKFVGPPMPDHLAAPIKPSANGTVSRKPGLPIDIGLADEGDEYLHHGTIDFVDNVVNRQTGTLRVRGVFDNPKRLLTPGMYCRVRLPVGAAHEAVLVKESALNTDQGRKFLFVLDAENKVSQRDVQIGSLHDGLRVVDNLKVDERIVIEGLQRVKSGGTVDPKLTKMTPDKEKATDIPMAPRS